MATRVGTNVNCEQVNTCGNWSHYAPMFPQDLSWSSSSTSIRSNCVECLLSFPRGVEETFTSSLRFFMIVRIRPIVCGLVSIFVAKIKQQLFINKQLIVNSLTQRRDAEDNLRVEVQDFASGRLGRVRAAKQDFIHPQRRLKAGNKKKRWYQILLDACYGHLKNISLVLH